MQANDTGAKPKRDRAPFLSLISAIVRQRFRTAPALPKGSGPATPQNVASQNVTLLSHLVQRI